MGWVSGAGLSLGIDLLSLAMQGGTCSVKNAQKWTHYSILTQSNARAHPLADGDSHRGQSDLPPSVCGALCRASALLSAQMLKVSGVRNVWKEYASQQETGER
ncbi:hypothetical protein SKAU_G00089210 [Synaphobranchus kaupii]|uniref:Uncharacterized protein n=1 Tax=Synaphobranchus kaupii TaxID=118154 RepID=A0A9Q1FX63_SYNKA|nr:hypothetical protein SKAU_G00089210 [Synaphobranchus kaupii]